MKADPREGSQIRAGRAGRRRPDLFGGFDLVREWGRIGLAGRLRIDPYPTPADAQAALESHRCAKERRSYMSASAETLSDHDSREAFVLDQL